MVPGGFVGVDSRVERVPESIDGHILFTVYMETTEISAGASQTGPADPADMLGT